MFVENPIGELPPPNGPQTQQSDEMELCTPSGAQEAASPGHLGSARGEKMEWERSVPTTVNQSGPTASTPEKDQLSEAGTGIAVSEPKPTASKKNKVGLLKLERESKAVAERFASVAEAAQSVGVTYKQMYGAAHNHNILNDHYWFLIDGDASDQEAYALLSESIPRIKWAQSTRQKAAVIDPPAYDEHVADECVVGSDSSRDHMQSVRPTAVGGDVATELLWEAYQLPKRTIRPFDKTNYDCIDDMGRFDMQADSHAIEQIDAATGQVVRRYRNIKQAARAMQLKYDRLYLRCHNCGGRPSTLGNFYWRFYSPPSGGAAADLSEEDFVPVSDLLKIRLLSRDNNASTNKTLVPSHGREEGVSAEPSVNVLADGSLDMESLCDVDDPPPDPEFDPQNPSEYLVKGKVIEQLHPRSKEVVRRYKCAKDASSVMKVENAKLYMRCFNHSAKSTPLGNFYWRFYTPGVSPEQFAEVPFRDLLKIRFSETGYNSHYSNAGADSSTHGRKRTLPDSTDWSEGGFDTEGRSSAGLSARAAAGRMVEQLDISTKRVVRRYRSVKEAADVMQLPDREKLYLRCYRASDRTNSLCNFFWRFHVPDDGEDEVTEEDFVPVEDLLAIRYADEVVARQNKPFSGKLTASPAGMDSEDEFENGSYNGLDFDREIDLGDGLDAVPMQHSDGKSGIARRKRGPLDVSNCRNASKVVEQIDVRTKKVVRRYAGAKLAAQSMDLPYDKVYLRCYNQKRRHVSTPLGNFYWRWQEGTEDSGVTEDQYTSIEELLVCRYDEPSDHSTPRAGQVGKRRKKDHGALDDPLGYGDMGGYSGLDEFANASASPMAAPRSRELPRAVEQLDKKTGKVLRRYNTAKEAAVTMQIAYNKLYLRCYNRGNKSTSLGNFLWRFHSPEDNGPDLVDEKDFVSIDNLLKIRYSGNERASMDNAKANDNNVVAEDVGLDTEDESEDGFGARFEAAIEAAESSLRQDNEGRADGSTESGDV